MELANEACQVGCLALPAHDQPCPHKSDPPRLPPPPGMPEINLVCGESASGGSSLATTAGADCTYLPKTTNRNEPNLFFSDKLAGATLVIAENTTHIFVAHVRTKAEVMFARSPPADMIDMLCKEQVRPDEGWQGGRGQVAARGQVCACGGMGPACRVWR